MLVPPLSPEFSPLCCACCCCSRDRFRGAQWWRGTSPYHDSPSLHSVPRSALLRRIGPFLLFLPLTSFHSVLRRRETQERWGVVVVVVTDPRECVRSFGTVRVLVGRGSNKGLWSPDGPSKYEGGGVSRGQAPSRATRVAHASSSKQVLPWFSSGGHGWGVGFWAHAAWPPVIQAKLLPTTPHQARILRMLCGRVSAQPLWVGELGRTRRRPVQARPAERGLVGFLAVKRASLLVQQQERQWRVHCIPAIRRAVWSYHYGTARAKLIDGKKEKFWKFLEFVFSQIV
jgi:hypothetical protein